MALIIVLVLIAVVAIIVMWYVSTQRELVNLDEKCSNALSQIEVQMNSRWDALLALAKATAKYEKYEGEALVKIIEARRSATVRTANDVNEQQSGFAEVMNRLMAVHEEYPELKASGLYEKAMDGIEKYEENVRMARMIYNDSATRMNRYVRQWPSSFVARQLNFSVKEYLKIDDSKKRDMPELFT